MILQKMEIQKAVLAEIFPVKNSSVEIFIQQKMMAEKKALADMAKKAGGKGPLTGGGIKKSGKK